MFTSRSGKKWKTEPVLYVCLYKIHKNSSGTVTGASARGYFLFLKRTEPYSISWHAWAVFPYTSRGGLSVC